MNGMLHPATSMFGGTRLLSVLAAAVAVAVVCVAPVVTASLLVEDEAVAVQFWAFKQQYDKAYATLEEEAHRLRVFKENMADAKVLNAANPYALFGVTPFSDLTRDEFKERHANDAEHFAAALRDRKPTVSVTGSAPSSVDWRTRGAVTSGKARGGCSGCRAFATIGAIGSGGKVAGGLVSTSKYGVKQNSGTAYTEDAYPYVSANELVPSCNANNRTVDAGPEYLPQDESEIAAYLAQNGPVSIVIDASSLLQYKGGIVTECSAAQLNHAVLLVGYNDAVETPYWVTKNSWGMMWGEQGYLRIKKGENTCLMKSHAVAARLATKSA